MKRLLLILSETLRDQRQELKLTAVIYLTVTVCFLSIFVCFRVAEKNKLIYEDADLAARTYNDIFIPAEEFSSCVELADALKSVRSIFSAEFSGLRFKTDNMPLYVELEGLGRIDESIGIVFEGIDADSITVNGSALYMGKPVLAGDTLKVDGKEFTVSSVGSKSMIGITDFSSLSLEMSSLEVSVQSIVTEHPLDSLEKERICSLLHIKTITSKSETAETENRSVSADQKLSCLLIAALSVLVILTLFKQVMLRAAPRLGMFRLYGARNSFITAFFLIYLLGYILIPFAAALGIYALLDSTFCHFYLEYDAAFSYKIFALGAVALLSLIFTLPQLVSILKKQPAEFAVRR